MSNDLNPRSRKFPVQMPVGRLAILGVGLVALVFGGALLHKFMKQDKSQTLTSKHSARASERRLPSSEEVVYSEESIEDLEQTGREMDQAYAKAKPARGAARVLPFEAVRGPSSVSFASIAAQRTGVKGKRAREVILHPEAFLDSSDEYRVTLNLFDDFAPIVVMQRPSVYGVNHAFHVGQIANDASSQVQLMIADGAMNGTVRGVGGTYKIISTSPNHAYIIELAHNDVGAKK